MKDGNNSIENTSLVKENAHQYLHSLPRAIEEEANDMIREYKLSCASVNQNGIQTQSFDLSYDIKDYISIPVYENIKEKER